VWLIAGIPALATMALAAGVIIATHKAARPAPVPGPGTVGAPSPTAAAPAPPAAPPPPAAPSDPGTVGTPPSAAAALEADFAQLKTKLHAAAGIVVSPVGNGAAPMTLGDWQTGPAWSTIKVPLIIAALRQENSTTPTAEMTAAITESDNAAAESIWEGLGDPVTAAHKVEAVLRETGDPTTVESQKKRPEFTAFGQTIWPLTDQVRFTSAAWCDNANAPVFDLMGQIAQDQSWGIGTIAGTRFKGGWGPSPTGSYLVRQIGVLAAPDGNGMIAVALAAQPASGKFDDGIADLTEMAKWLKDHLGALPAGQCGH
jgi:hypothetical protein